MKKKLVLATALTLATVSSFSACSSNVAFALPTYADDKEITIGIWNGSRHDLNDLDLYNLQQAGINLLVGADPTKMSQRELVERSAEFDINVILDGREGKWNGETPDFVDMENFWGFSLYDEPFMGHLNSLQSAKERYDEKLPGKMFFVNMLPSSGSETDYYSYLKTFVDGLDLEMCSYDNYSLMLDEETDEIYIRDTYLFDFDVASHVAKEAGVPMWYTLLTSGHLRYTDPTTTELEWQMYLAMTYGAQALIHYVYATHDPDYVYPIVNYLTGEVTEKYYRVQEANGTIRSWDHIYLNFDWLGTSNVEGSNGGTGLLDWTIYNEAIDTYGEIVSAEATEDVIVGHFKDGNDNAGFMVTNITNPVENKTTEVSVKLASKYKGAIVIHEGNEEIVALKKNKLNLEIEAGSAMFVIPLEEKK
ncbi:MAG: hypothetical protein IJX49_00200 [Clostridia bacterium]|nr:hypothetical protein [Clostridia bacterium]